MVGKGKLINMGLTIAFVERIGFKLFGKKHFLGCFPADIHPNVKKKKVFSIIFNLSQHNEEGTHYIAIFANEKEIIYFDSYGKKCTNKNILKFIQKEKDNRHFKISNKQIQDCKSNFCGYFCLGFIFSQQIGLSFSKFLGFFIKNHDNLFLNDEIIIFFIKCLVKK